MKVSKFIILPAKGLVARSTEKVAVDPNVTDFLTKLSGHVESRKTVSMKSKRLRTELPIKVLDSVRTDGAKLIALDPERISQLHLAFPGIRIVPEVFFYKAVVPRQQLAPSIKKRAIGKSIRITVTGKDGKGVGGAQIVAFTDFENRQGAQGTTSANGVATLTLPSMTDTIERLYIYPENTYWPLLKKNVKFKGLLLEVLLTSIDINYIDGVKYFYDNHNLPPLEKTIKVGVIDTGVGPHDDINLVGGECTVENENPEEYADYDGHGTHVAGIISSFARTPSRKPCIEIFSFRVFPKTGDGASNYSIVKAIDRAIEKGCHLINMSLGGGDADDATKDAIADAQSKGVICFVATGNDDRGPVSFPANYSLSLAVGAMGRKGTFPKDSEPNDSVKAPYGKDKDNFVASFSNIGPEVDLIAPGVGIISCAPENRYAVMSGTSMACPAATGMAARLLIVEGSIMNQQGDSNRSNAMIKFLGTKLKSLGFEPRFEGQGMLGIG
ncbi:MAG TPA: S8 family serine peptidase [Chryseolinea sp.]|nr:S8 family serine peptidase [Chryseolinea sp.]